MDVSDAVPVMITAGNAYKKTIWLVVYEKMKEDDVIVYASPVYFYSFNAQMKAVMLDQLLKNTPQTVIGRT